MKSKKIKPRCKNCGDETTFPENCDERRQDRGWCVPCFRKDQQKVEWGDGNVRYQGENKELYRRTPFTSPIVPRRVGGDDLRDNDRR